jgi:3-oxoacyl-[acyl-carrier protein] reductase
LDLENELKTFNINAKGYKSDAGNYLQSEKLIVDVLSDFETIDILINNAGITKDGLLMRMTEENWDMVIDANLKSVFNLTKAILKVFLKNKAGSIINMSSVVGVQGNAGQANYAASKAGMIGFTKSVARELASRGITANSVAPGYIQTEMTAKLNDKTRDSLLQMIPLGKLGTPGDVAGVCIFLASNEANYITGQTILVDGGMAM